VITAAERRKYLGGSDAAAVLGVSSWMTPVELWQLKTGKAKPTTTPEQERRWKRGHKLEPFIRSMVIDKLADEGHDVELLACNARYADPEYPFLSCEIDFELRLDGEEINADAKSVDRFARDKWGAVGTDAMPIEYVAQGMHGLGVTPGRRRRTLFAALRSWDDVDIYWLTRDDETIAAMREKEVSFWLDHVVPKVPPDPTKFSDVRALFPKATRPAIEATPEVLAKVERIRALERQQAEGKAEIDMLKFEIGRFMGKHALLKNGVRDLVTWDNQPRKVFDEKAFKREHPDWFALYMKTETTRVMRKASSRG
jgi:predicted phage-related endonuclease